MTVRLRDVDLWNLLVDPVHQSIVSGTLEDEAIHDGQHFQFCTYDADIDDTETIEYLITTPAVNDIHFTWAVTGTTKTLCQLFEDSTRTTTDDAETTFNTKRSCTDTADLVIQPHSTTDGADGTQIDCSSFGAGTTGPQSNSVSGEAKTKAYWLLDSDTVYLFRLTSGAADNNVTIKFGWSEHT